MEITLGCGGSFRPLEIAPDGTAFRCSRGCVHPIDDDLRSLAREAGERRRSNEVIRGVRRSKDRKIRWFAWIAGIGSLAGIDSLYRHAAAHAGPYVEPVVTASFLGAGLLIAIGLVLRYRIPRD